jgi:microcystin-dependent protein
MAKRYITPSDINAAPEDHEHSADEITSGLLALARLGSGSPDAGDYLRGDGAWSDLTAAVQAIVGSATGFSSGDLKVSARATPESGWSLCDAGTLSRTTEASLFNAITVATTGTTVNGSATVTVASSANMAVGDPVEGPGIAIGTTILTVNSGTQITLSANAGAGAGAGTIRALAYGQGNGTTTFNKPGFRGRAILAAGSGPGLTARRRGEQGGAESVALALAEMPAHTHSTGFSRPSDVSVTGGGNRINGAGTDVSIATDSKGSGTAHNNMSPYGVANVFIKL